MITYGESTGLNPTGTNGQQIRNQIESKRIHVTMSVSVCNGRCNRGLGIIRYQNRFSP